MIRGRHTDRARQAFHAERLVYGTISPTDIDHSMDFNCRFFVLFEYKRSGKSLPPGQRLHLQALAEAIEAGAHSCLVIIAEHDGNGYDLIEAGDLEVREVWWRGEWYRHNGTVRAAVDLARKHWGL